ncbi:MAG: hypothetical protein JXA18_15435, partial [Chitinispirillaceae bacterium]|nr:hypothetical protein [Chitinispirillaceae bacterium]
ATSGTLLDMAFLAAVKAAVRAWLFCPVDDTIGNQEVSFQISFADKNGMVRSILQQTDDILMKKNRRIFKKWCGDAIRKAYRHWLAFKGPAHGSLDFKCTCDNGHLAAIELTGGSLADHPITEVILPLKSQLVGKRFRGNSEKDTAYFTLLLLDLRAKITVFDGKMEYQDVRGWYYTDPFLFNSPNIPQWKPPNIPMGF